MTTYVFELPDGTGVQVLNSGRVFDIPGGPGFQEPAAATAATFVVAWAVSANTVIASGARTG